MTSYSESFDQSYASLQDALDELITEWRASLGRKAERHGEKFDSAKATFDLFNRMAGAPREAIASFAAVAVDRLAHMPDYSPVPHELKDLDFHVDVKALLAEDAPEGGATEEESDDSQE